MSSLQTRLQDPGYQLWIKAGMCLSLVKEGLENFAFDKSVELHALVTDKLKKKGSLSVLNGICGNAAISYNKVQKQWELRCSCNCCQGFLDELSNYRSTSLGANKNQCFTFTQRNFENSDLRDWPTEPWQLAKVFMNQGQKSTDKGPKDTDLSGILNFIDHCCVARKDIMDTANISKVRDSRNRIMHSATMKLDQTEFTSFTEAMIDLLQDKMVISGYPEAKKAERSIQEVRASRFNITTETECGLLEEVIVEIFRCNKELHQDIRNIYVRVSELKEDNDIEEKKTADALQKEISLLEDGINKLTQIAENVTKQIAADKYLKQKLDSHISTLHISLNETREETQAAHREIEALRARIQDVEIRVQLLSDKLQSYICAPETLAVDIGHKKFKKDYQQLQQYIVDEYTRVYHDVCLTPVLEGLNSKVLRSSVDDIYTEIKVVKPDGKGEMELESYNDIFTSDGIRNRTIFVKGEAGIGKSTWCMQLIQAWCRAQKLHTDDSSASVFMKCFLGTSDDSNNDQTRMRPISKVSSNLVPQCMQNAMSQFDFLFYIPLRYAETKLTVLDMLFTSTLERFAGFKLLLGVLIKHFSEKILLILDGLDEYGSDIGFKGLNLSTVIVTTRPWKYDAFCLANPRLKPDLVLTLKGLSSDGALELTEKFIRITEDSPGTENPDSYIAFEAASFHKEIEASGLADCMRFPLVLLSLMQCWFENEKSLSLSLTQNMQLLLKLLILRAKAKKSNLEKMEYNLCKNTDASINIPCFEGDKTLTEFANVAFQLSNLAFEGLFGPKVTLAVTFDMQQVQKHISSDALNICFKVGILTQSDAFTSVLQNQRTSVTFYHKLMQEFFAALLIVSKESVMLKFMELIHSLDDLLKMEYVLVFICGLDPIVGSKLTNNFVNVCNSDKYILSYRDNHSSLMRNALVENYTSTILKCKKEIIESRRSDEQIFISDIILYRSVDNLSPVIIQHSRNHLKTVRICYISLPQLLLKQLCHAISYAVTVENLEIILSQVTNSGVDETTDVKLDLSNLANLRELKVIESVQHFINVETLGTISQIEHLCLDNVKCSWKNLAPLKQQHLQILSLNCLDISDVCLAVIYCDRLQRIALGNARLMCINLAPALHLQEFSLDNVTMPETSWNTFFRSLHVDHLRKFTLCRIGDDGIILNLGNISKLDVLQMMEVSVQEIQLQKHVNIQHLFLYKVQMPPSSWMSFFASIQAEHMLSLKLVELKIDEDVRITGIKHLEKLHITDVSFSDLKFGNETNITEISVQNASMPDKSWNNLFISSLPRSVCSLSLVSLNISDHTVNLEMCSSLSNLKIIDVKLHRIILSNNSSLQSMELINVSMPQNSWRNIFKSVEKLKLHSLTLQLVDCGDACVDLSECMELQDLKLVFIELGGLMFGQSAFLEEIWMEKVTMPQKSWRRLFESHQTQNLRSLTLLNVNMNDSHVIINLTNYTSLEILKVTGIRVSEIKLGDNEQFKVVELESLTMSKSSWKRFFEKLSTVDLCELCLNHLDIANAVIHVNSRTQLQRLVLLNVVMSKTCYGHLLAIRASNKYFSGIKVGRKVHFSSVLPETKTALK